MCLPSSCRAQLGPWQAHCGEDDKAAALADLRTASFTTWIGLQAATAQLAGCGAADGPAAATGASAAAAADNALAGVTVVYNGTARHATATYLNIGNQVLRATGTPVRQDPR